MNEVYVLTGGNMGDREAFLEKAKAALESECGTIGAASSIYETAAWGNEAQPSFLNQALLLYTPLSAFRIMDTILLIEETMGRRREEKYGPRIIDIDILFYNNEMIDAPGLQLPHPWMQERRFVLKPLSEIAANKVHPVTGRTVAQLLEACTDPLPVHKFHEADA